MSSRLARLNRKAVGRLDLMEIQVTPDTIRRARRVAIFGSWTIWLAATALALTTHIAQLWVVALWIAGFAPYILSIQVVEPWLQRRLRGETPN